MEEIIRFVALYTIFYIVLSTYKREYAKSNKIGLAFVIYFSVLLLKFMIIMRYIPEVRHYLPSHLEIFGIDIILLFATWIIPYMLFLIILNMNIIISLICSLFFSVFYFLMEFLYWKTFNLLHLDWMFFAQFN